MTTVRDFLAARIDAAMADLVATARFADRCRRWETAERQKGYRLWQVLHLTWEQVEQARRYANVSESVSRRWEALWEMSCDRWGGKAGRRQDRFHERVGKDWNRLELRRQNVRRIAMRIGAREDLVDGPMVPAEVTAYRRSIEACRFVADRARSDFLDRVAALLPTLDPERRVTKKLSMWLRYSGHSGSEESRNSIADALTRWDAASGTLRALQEPIEDNFVRELRSALVEVTQETGAHDIFITDPTADAAARVLIRLATVDRSAAELV